MKKVDLFSREWCDLIFHDRNKSYGAYKIRKEAGKRYRRALLWLFLSLLLFLGTPLGLHLYMRYQLYKSFTAFEKEIPKLKRKEAEKGHELKLSRPDGRAPHRVPSRELPRKHRNWSR